MGKARKICAEPGCPEFMPCPAHAKKPWEDSARRERTVSGWEQQRRAKRVLHRHDARCHVCGDLGADQADHVIPLGEGGPDSEDNMRPIHSVPCHETKTQREAEAARATRGHL